ncbi:hypothetical protein Tco_1147271 [Tanacetum coccineum]
MPPRKAPRTRTTPATTTTTTTSVTNEQLKALIDQGIVDALAARDADRSMNGDDSHNSGTGVRRQVPLAHESVVTGRSVVLSSLCANVSEGRTEEAADIRMLMSTARRILY